jgi:hypothetical protein
MVFVVANSSALVGIDQLGRDVVMVEQHKAAAPAQAPTEMRLKQPPIRCDSEIFVAEILTKTLFVLPISAQKPTEHTPVFGGPSAGKVVVAVF